MEMESVERVAGRPLPAKLSHQNHLWWREGTARNLFLLCAKFSPSGQRRGLSLVSAGSLVMEVAGRLSEAADLARSQSKEVRGFRTSDCAPLVNQRGVAVVPLCLS